VNLATEQQQNSMWNGEANAGALNESGRNCLLGSGRRTDGIFLETEEKTIKIIN
jgi:hypothetical protein